MPSLLVIEDEPALAHRLERALSEHEVRITDSGAEGLELFRNAAPDLVLLDLRLPDASGLDVLKEIRALDSDLPVVLMTAYSSVEDAVEAMRRGATDYLSKPLDFAKLRIVVDTLLARQRQDRELAYHRARELPTGFLSVDPGVHRIFEDVDQLARTKLPPGRRPPILLTGETGTGKGVLARAIHDRLGGGPFIEVNCTAMPAALVEAELFGHERGSFTDARTSRTGLFEAAEGGVIFLDEIGHLPHELQAKFLKVIEEKRVRRLGSSTDRAVDVHVIAATNRDLDRAVAENDFRDDLLHRLRVLSFEIPPLRERQQDIVLLARHFCEAFGREYRGKPASLDAESEKALSRYDWPGNVRELRNVIDRAVLLSAEDAVRVDLLPRSAGAAPSGRFCLPEEGLDLEEHERDLIRQALERAGGNRTQAAALLGLTRHTLRYRLEKFGLE